MGIDGTVMDVPDSPANEERFGRSSGGRGDAAFPQIRKLSLVELGTHVETALAIGGYHDSEQKLVVQLFDKIPDDALLLEDRNFFSYDHWKELDSRGVKLLVRIKSNMILKPIERLPDGSCLAKIYPSSYDRDKDRKGIVVRVIEYTLDDPLRTGHGETHRLLTNLLDYMMFPAMELICLYHERWEEEQVYDEQKTHQDPRRPTKPAHFRSQTPEGVEQEIYALSLAHFVVRALMLEAAKQENQDADRLSFTGCFQILQARLPECQSSTPAELEQWYRLLLEEMAQSAPSRAAIGSTRAWWSARCRSSPRNVPRIAANRRLRKPLLSQWLSLDERYCIFSSGRVGDGHWSRFHRFFSHAAWDIDTFSMCLAKSVVTILAPGCTFFWAVDDTLCRKRGLTLYGARHTYDLLISSLRPNPWSVGDTMGCADPDRRLPRLGTVQSFRLAHRHAPVPQPPRADQGEKESEGEKRPEEIHQTQARSESSHST